MVKFNDNVEISYKDKNIYINNEKFEYNSKLNKQIKTDFVYFLLFLVHNKKNKYSKENLINIFSKEKYINYNKFVKLLYYIKNKIFLNDYVFSSNEYIVLQKRRNLYRKWLLYVCKYELEACIRIQSVIRGYIVRKIKID
tara:strand:- start:2108 stop:2527 length:420 start_codon:yes stop_codon:yes gene_type:complete